MANNYNILDTDPGRKVYKGTTVITATQTYNRDASVTEIVVECIAAGGGGGGAAGGTATAGVGGGGQAGGYAMKRIASPASSYEVTIGAGGLGGAAGNNNGAAGGDTSFGTACVAKGGLGGTGHAASATQHVTLGGGGTPAGSVGDITSFGQCGFAGIMFDATAAGGQIPGDGGACRVGSGAPALSSADGFDAVGWGYGGGGAGAGAQGTGDTSAGGDGAPGVCYVHEYGSP